MEREILEYLYNKQDGKSNSLEIIQNLGLHISNDKFDRIIEHLLDRGYLQNIHPQYRSEPKLKYD